MSRPVYLLDTNTCSFIMKGNRGVVARIDRQPRGRVVTSAIAWGELLFGALRSRQRVAMLQRLDVLRESIPVLELGADASAHYAEIRVALAVEGRQIGPQDLWIAAHARSEGLCVVTNNEREFRRVPGLKVENWIPPA